jgi:hypothetical protein
MGKAARPWGVRPHIFDIAWARFPYHGQGGRPANDLHPCLIVQVVEADADGSCWVAAFYGTSKLRMHEERDQIDALVMNVEEMSRMGLRCATRFDLDRPMWMPWTDEYFVESKANVGSPVHARATEALIFDFKESLRIRIARGLPAYPVNPPIPLRPPFVPDGATLSDDAD